MNVFDDWKFCLSMAVGTFALMICTGDVMGLMFFPFYYWLALKNFNREMTK